MKRKVKQKKIVVKKIEWLEVRDRYERVRKCSAIWFNDKWSNY